MSKNTTKRRLADKWSAIIEKQKASNMSVSDTHERMLNHPQVKALSTQNDDGTVTHPKLLPIHIGLRFA